MIKADTTECGRDEKKKLTASLKGLSSQEFQHYFEYWKRRLDRYIASNGEYFEGDKNESVKTKWV